MNRLKTATLALLLLACAPFARAAADPVSVEVKWNEKITAITTTSISALTFDLGGFGTTGYALLGATYTANGVDGIPFGTQVAITTTNFPTLNTVAFDYEVLSLGATALLQISQTLKTPAPLGLGVHGNGNTTVVSTSPFNSPFPAANLFTSPVFSTSAFITIPANTLYPVTFRGQVYNPIFKFSGLTTNATLYFQVDYGVPKLQ